MSEVSIFRRHRDLFWALLLSASIVILDYQEFIQIRDVPPLLPISIYTGVFAIIGTCMIIFTRYEEVISRAKQADMRPLIHSVFKYPAVSSAIGLLHIIIVSFVDISLDINYVYISGLIYLAGMPLQILLLVYSILAIFEALSFVRRVMMGEG